MCVCVFLCLCVCVGVCVRACGIETDYPRPMHTAPPSGRRRQRRLIPRSSGVFKISRRRFSLIAWGHEARAWASVLLHFESKFCHESVLSFRALSYVLLDFLFFPLYHTAFYTYSLSSLSLIHPCIKIHFWQHLIHSYLQSHLLSLIHTHGVS